MKSLGCLFLLLLANAGHFAFSQSGKDPLDQFYPVFWMSDSSYGRVIILKDWWDEKTGPQIESEKLYHRISQILTPKGWDIDTRQNPPGTTLAEAFRGDTLIKFDSLTAMFRDEIGKDYTVVCTRGTVRVKVKDVVFQRSLCNIPFVMLRFTKMDESYLGKPVFALKDHFRRFYFGPFTKTDATLQAWDVARNHDDDFVDAYPAKTAARTDSLWFGYNDSFEWAGKPNGECLYPARFIFVLRPPGQLVLKREYALDEKGRRCE